MSVYSDEDYEMPQVALGGEELEEYCKKHGLCNLCAQTRTHKRVFRLKKKNQWQPLTIKNSDDGEYIVYKGYCVQPGCFTMEQAKRLAGDVGPKGGPSAGKPSRGNRVDRNPESAFVEGQNEEVPKGKKGRKGISRLLMGRGRKKNKNANGSAAAPPSSSFDGMTGFSSTNRAGKSRGSLAMEAIPVRDPCPPRRAPSNRKFDVTMMRFRLPPQ